MKASTSLDEQTGAPFVLSRFAIGVGSADGKRVTHLYSSLRGNWVALNEPLEAELELLQALQLSSDSVLAQAGLAVRRDVDELEALRRAWGLSTQKARWPTFTIAPTMTCNFGCEYCFESHTKGVMSLETQEQLARFMVEQIDRVIDDGPAKAHVTWFGGEPLMAFPVIESVMGQLDRIGRSSRHESVEWSSSIITNGYLLDQRRADRLASMGVSLVQITLDGPPRHHDRLRMLKVSGKPTFDTIVENIHQVPKSMGVLLRMNVQRSNVDSVQELCEVLERRGILDRVKVSPALVENFCEGPVPASMLTSQEFADSMERLERIAGERGWPLSDIGTGSRAFRGVCQVDTPNSWTIDFDGTLRTCWAEMGTTEGKVGSLADWSGGSAPRRGELAARDPFDDAECIACPVLPSCMGGCPKTRAARRAAGTKQCPSWKYSLDSSLRRAIASQRHQGQSRCAE